MERDIIDLTVSSPVPEVEHVHIDSKGPLDALTSELAQDQRKKSRRKKRRMSLTEGDSQENAAHTREQSVEERQLDSVRKRQCPDNGKHVADVDARQERGHRVIEHNLRRHHLRSRSPRHDHAFQSNVDASDVFFIDVTPTQLPPAAQFTTTSRSEGDEEGVKLLLPAHVSVFGTVPVDIIHSPVSDPDQDDYIEYLDYEDQKDLVRYFDDAVSESAKKSNRTVCKNCGAEGEHRTASCPVLICLTCGARNEHHTRSCPISKKCFTCGMKGHINSTCPNRNNARTINLNRYDDCDRCGSHLHKANECPTLWRLYEYLTDDESINTIRTRQDKKDLRLGQGGEGYIARDEWCYNCGNCGHWGDDCQDMMHREDLPAEPSAFSSHNTMSGPFFDPTSEPMTSTSRREPRDWEQVDNLPRGWGNNAPENVGRQARRKNVAKMAQRAQEEGNNDDKDDWFGNLANMRNREATMATRNGKGPSSVPRKMSFAKSVRDAGRQFRPAPSAPSLLERLGDKVYDGGSHGRHRERPPDSRSFRNNTDNGSSSHSKARDDRYARGHDRGRDKYHQRGGGPRYSGGYTR